MDCSLPGFSAHGILQARTLEWVAISFSNACKWKVKVKSLIRVRLLATPWTAAYQAPPFIGFSGQQYWSRVPLPSPVDICYTISTCILRCEAIIFPSTLIKNFTEVLFGLGIILTVSFLWGFWEDSYTTSPLPPSSLKVFSYFLKE